MMFNINGYNDLSLSFKMKVNSFCLVKKFNLGYFQELNYEVDLKKRDSGSN